MVWVCAWVWLERRVLRERKVGEWRFGMGRRSGGTRGGGVRYQLKLGLRSGGNISVRRWISEVSTPIRVSHGLSGFLDTI